ncbi:MAG: hypothetical protein AAB389_02335 [Patescibacteria group bacterium]
MEIPYSKRQLELAIVGVPKEIGDEENEKVKKLRTEFESRMPKTKKEFNQKVADDNGITVKQLIDCPNYALLCQDYGDRMRRDLVEAMKKEFNITDIQAWSVIAAGMGLI